MLALLLYAILQQKSTLFAKKVGKYEYLKKVLLIGLMFLLGGIVMQSLGYIDSPILAWFTDITLYDIGV